MPLGALSVDLQALLEAYTWMVWKMFSVRTLLSVALSSDLSRWAAEWSGDWPPSISCLDEGLTLADIVRGALRQDDKEWHCSDDLQLYKWGKTESSEEKNLRKIWGEVEFEWTAYTS